MNIAEYARNNMLIGQMISGDSKHECLYDEFGYPVNVDYYMARRAYERVGIAKGAIHFLHDKAFESNPEVYEGEEDKKEKSSNEKQFDLFAKKTKLWRAYKTACIRRSIGNYSALIVQIADGKNWDQPVGKIRPDQIKKFIPAWEDQLLPMTWEQDTYSPNYGNPLQFEYMEFDMNAAKRTVATPTRALTIHPDRVIWFGDIQGNGSEPEEGTMLLRSGFNSLLDWQKIRGSGAEGFYKNAARHLSASFEGAINPQQLFEMSGAKDATEFKEKLNDLASDINKNFDTIMALLGAKVEVLSTNLPSSDPFSETALKDFAASMNLSAKGIVGSQTGERASSEDSIMDNKTATSYRENTLDFEILKIMEKFSSYGMWSGIDWNVSWDSLLDASDTEKLEIAERMAKVNAALLATGEMVFTTPEIRIAGGYEGESDEEIKPADLEKVPVDERIEVEI